MATAKSKLKVYFVELSDDGEGLGYISESANKAKHYAAVEESCDYTELRAHIAKGVKLRKSDKEGKQIDTVEGLRRGVYGDSREMECKCEMCGKEEPFCRLEKDGRKLKIMCSKCADEAEAD